MWSPGVQIQEGRFDICVANRMQGAGSDQVDDLGLYWKRRPIHKTGSIGIHKKVGFGGQSAHRHWIWIAQLSQSTHVPKGE